MLMGNNARLSLFSIFLFSLIVAYQNFDQVRWGSANQKPSMILNLPDQMEGNPQNYVYPTPHPMNSPNNCEMNFKAVSDRTYRYGTYTCHQFANSFCDANGEAVVVQCGQDVSGYGGHTINLGPDPDNQPNGICLVEPQNGSKCCFERPNNRDTCGNYYVDLTKGDAAECAEELCQGQYKPKYCRPLPPFARAGTVQFRYSVCVQDASGSRQKCLDCLSKVTQERNSLIARWLKQEPTRACEDIEDLAQEAENYRKQCPQPKPTPKPSAAPTFQWRPTYPQR